VTTDSDAYAAAMREFRTHGMRRGEDCVDVLKGPWHYDVVGLGFNYRITDFQCALGLSQLSRLDEFVAERNRVAELYRGRLAGTEGLILPAEPAPGDRHAYHLFVVRFPDGPVRRRQIYDALRAEGIGTQLHYIPIYRHSLYRALGYDDVERRCPNAERYYREALSLPIFPAMTHSDVERVARALEDALRSPCEPEREVAAR
jgi:dTDP-4-amino-4,6-dideoxygalactose transaminase